MLDDPVKVVGVKPADATRLEKLGITTVRDLLLTLPYDREAFGAPTAVANVVDGEGATVVGRLGKVISRRPFRARRGLKLITETTLYDEDGAQLHLVWFNQNFIGKALHEGMRLAVAGEVKGGRYGRLQMVGPQFEVLEGDGAQAPTVGGIQPK